jgi:hypothetical protein
VGASSIILGGRLGVGGGRRGTRRGMVQAERVRV